MRTYLAPNRKTGAQENAAALAVLAELLGGSGTTSVLAKALTFENPKAVYVSADYNGDALDSGTFSLAIVPVPGVSLEEAEAAMDGVVAQFLKDGVDPVALERIKTQVRASQIYGRDNVEGLANQYGEALTTGLTIADVQAWPDVLQAVTAEDVMAAARDVLDRRQSVTGWLTADAEATP
jgi:zinc protease